MHNSEKRRQRLTSPRRLEKRRRQRREPGPTAPRIGIPFDVTVPQVFLPLEIAVFLA